MIMLGMLCASYDIGRYTLTCGGGVAHMNRIATRGFLTRMMYGLLHKPSGQSVTDYAPPHPKYALYTFYHIYTLEGLIGTLD